MLPAQSRKTKVTNVDFWIILVFDIKRWQWEQTHSWTNWSSRLQVFLKVLKNSRKHLCRNLCFIKVAGLRPAALRKNYSSTGVFLWNLNSGVFQVFSCEKRTPLVSASVVFSFVTLNVRISFLTIDFLPMTWFNLFF